MRYLAILCCLCILSASYASAQDAAPTISFTMEANATEYIVGTPVLLKLTLRNDGETPCSVDGLGWGRGLGIKKASPEEDFKGVPVDRIHLDTDLGPAFFPLYTYTYSGQLKPKEEQSILYMIRTRDWQPGQIRLKASLFAGHDSFETPEISIFLTEDTTDDKNGVFSREERGSLHHAIVSEHNNYAYSTPGPNPYGAAWVEKAIQSNEATLDVEYALYFGVLRASHKKVALPELNLAEQSGQAFLDRFPESWLRAQVCALLARVSLDKAACYLEMGRALPESHPLYKKLHVPEKLETAEWPTGLFPQNDAM